MTALTDTPFFHGIAQTELPIRQYRGKSPMFFAGATVMGALFPVDAATAQALMPGRDFHVITGPLGRAYLGVFAFAYEYTDIGPYNEVFFALGLSQNAGWSQPLRLARRMFSRALDAHVVQLPVDSEAALYGGLDYYNVPKFMTHILYTLDGGERVCTVRDPETGALVFELRGTRPSRVLRLPFSPLRRQTMRNYSRRDERTLVARFELHAPAPFFRPGSRHASLFCGEHPRARMIAALRPGPALGYFFAEGCEAVLYEPVQG